MSWWKFWDLGITKPAPSGVTVKIEKLERPEPWPPPPPDPKPELSPEERRALERRKAFQDRLQWFFDAIDYDHEEDEEYDALSFARAHVVAHTIFDAAEAILQTAECLGVSKSPLLNPEVSASITKRIKSLLHLGLREQAVREVGDYFLLRGVPADAITEALAEYREYSFDEYDDVKTCP